MSASIPWVFRTLLATVTAFAALPVHAQSLVSRRPICFQGARLPACTSYWITEVGLYTRVGGTYITDRETPALRDRQMVNHGSFEIGLMRNWGSNATGGHISFGRSEPGNRLGLLARHRRWLSPKYSLDVSAGPISAEIETGDHRTSLHGRGITGDVILGFADVAHVVVRADRVSENGQHLTAIYGGVRLGSKATIKAIAISAVVFAVMFAAMGAG